jgi:SAM-dependent methyltransferase
MRECPVCEGDRFEAALIAFDRTVAREGEFHYQRCATCRLLSQTPLPREDELPGFYPDSYRPHVPLPVAREVGVRRRDGRPWNRAALRALRTDRPRSRSRLEQAALWVLGRLVAPDIVLPRGDNRLLDVGCGSGDLLARHRALGWAVRGIEPNGRAVAACRAAGLEVEQADLLDAQLPDAYFDAVVFRHVVEHVHDPAAALARARQLLRPDGLLVVVTPNTAGIGLRAYGTCWYALDAPRHLHLFDARNLRRLAERVGLRAESLSVAGSTRVLARSRCYARVQGRRLPQEAGARRAVIARAAADDGTDDAVFRRLAGPFVALLSALGLGDTLRAHFVRDDA